MVGVLRVGSGGGVGWGLGVGRVTGGGVGGGPFMERGRAGGSEITEDGLCVLVGGEGGMPKDVPVACQPAEGRVRAKDESDRLPRAEVYGARR